jgi:hypothetical protein
VSSDYGGSRFEFTEGEIVKVAEWHLAAAMARDETAGP